MNILDAIFPVFFLLLAGKILNMAGLTNETFLKTSDRLVYFVFFPAMLFWKIGSAPPNLDLALGLCSAGILSVFAIYCLSLLLIRVFSISNYAAGTFSQACYRFNTYIGMAVVMNALGETGVRYFGLLIGFAIPIINVLAVSTLIWFSQKKETPLKTGLSLLRALVANPLILACTAGLLFSRMDYHFASFIDNTFKLMTAVTMPLALISIGGTLTPANIHENLNLSIIATLVKITLLPVIGFIFLKLFAIHGIAFKAGMIFFALPTSTAIYVLSSQLNSDTRLASSAIMTSTIFSFLSLSAVLLF